MNSSSQDLMDSSFVLHTISPCINGFDDRALGSGYKSKVHYAIVTVYLLIVVASVVLNASVCHFYRLGYVRPNAFNKLVLNLAIGGIFSALGIIPFVTVTPIMLRGITEGMASTICSFTTGKLFFLMGMCVSIATITLISLHRFFSINWPTSSLTRFVQRDQFAYFGIFFSWAFGIALQLPIVSERKYNSCFVMCQWKSKNSIKIQFYLGIMILLAYVIPMVVLLLTFLTSVKTFWCGNTSHAGIVTQTARKRVIAQLAMVMIVFFCCWSPLLFYWAVAEHYDLISCSHSNYYRGAKVMYILVLIALAQAVANPVLYGLKSPEFQRALSYRTQVMTTPEREEGDPEAGRHETSPLMG